MKILLLIDSLGIGGAETHVFELAGGLRELGAEVCVASSGGVRSLLGRCDKRAHAGIRNKTYKNKLSFSRAVFGGGVLLQAQSSCEARGI